MKKQIAQNEGRFYRVDMRQMRYFPIARKTAELLLATGQAVEVAYLPFSRPDLHQAHRVAQNAIAKAQVAA